VWPANHAALIGHSHDGLLEREPARRTLKSSCGDNRSDPLVRGDGKGLRSMKAAVRAMDERDVSAV
jgi:hypothetical protein